MNEGSYACQSLRMFTANRNENHISRSTRIAMMRCFGSIISGSLNIPSDLSIGKAQMKLGTPLISQLSLKFNNIEFYGNPLLTGGCEFNSNMLLDQK